MTNNNTEYSNMSYSEVLSESLNVIARKVELIEKSLYSNIEFLDREVNPKSFELKVCMEKMKSDLDILIGINRKSYDYVKKKMFEEGKEKVHNRVNKNNRLTIIQWIRDLLKNKN